MNCEKMQPLLSEYVNGALPAAQVWQVQTHVSQCPECALFVREIQSLGELLRSVPMRTPSDQFEARLGARLAGLPSHTAPVWHRWLGGLFQSKPVRTWSPVFAGAALVAVLIGHAARPIPETAIGSPAPSETVLVQHCVEQHRSDMAAQPLSDWSAQNLANRLDTNAASSPAAVTAADETGTL